MRNTPPGCCCPSKSGSYLSSVVENHDGFGIQVNSQPELEFGEADIEDRGSLVEAQQPGRLGHTRQQLFRQRERRRG